MGKKFKQVWMDLKDMFKTCNFGASCGGNRQGIDYKE